MKSHGTIVVGWDESGKVGFVKTFDFDEQTTTEKAQALEAFEYVSKNYPKYFISNASSALGDLLEKDKKWDALEQNIDQFYAEDSEADLGDIGEAVATAFGYL